MRLRRCRIRDIIWYLCRTVWTKWSWQASERPNGQARKTYYFDKIDSTNTKAKELAEEGHPSGTFVVADQQTAGKGTSRTVMGFPSGNGNLYDTHAQTGHQSEPCIHADPRDSDGSGKCNAPGDGSRGFDQMAE